MVDEKVVKEVKSFEVVDISTQSEKVIVNGKKEIVLDKQLLVMIYNDIQKLKEVLL